MNNRRDFLKTSFVAGSGMTLLGTGPLRASVISKSYTSNRPAMADRNFTSKAVEEAISKAKAKIKDLKIAWMFNFSLCF